MPTSSTNLKSRVNKLTLPRTKPLLPLFEMISNSIHAIKEKNIKLNKRSKGKIKINVIRNGDETILATLSDVEKYPIHSLEVIDTGIGLDSDNYLSFQEFDSEYKSGIGGQGVGRLVCLKAFQKLIVESVYFENGKYWHRAFEYKRTKEGFANYDGERESDKKNVGTKITLYKFEDEYLKNVPLTISEIAREIITHFQLYFIQKLQPEIIIRNQDSSEINLTSLFDQEFKKEILTTEFDVNGNNFHVFISKSYKAKSHKLHFCAHERTVKDEGLSRLIADLNASIKDADDSEGYYFQVFVVGEFLNKNVNEERTGFKFSNDDDGEELDFQEVTLARIRKGALQATEDLLKDFLTVTRKEKLERYLPIVESEYPNYKAVINYNKAKVERIPAGLSSQDLDIKLYEIESEWKLKIKVEGREILEKKKDITTLEQYQEFYGKYLTEFNEVGQSDLARYVVHRRSVIDLLEKLIELNAQNKFENEDIVHCLFFPIRETGDSVTHDKQNLWLLDERLTFNSLLSSDKQFRQVRDLKSQSDDRIDLIIRRDEVFESAALFTEQKTPLESFTIVEFKRPLRDDYKHGDEKRDPVAQVRKYIRETIDGKIKLRGRPIDAKENTPFYCYVIADITPTLKFIIDEETFTPTPDGNGYFRFYDTRNYKAYIEILPFTKVINDAKQRNRILFSKLNLR